MSIYSTVGHVVAIGDDSDPDVPAMVYVCASGWHDFIRLSVVTKFDEAFLTVEQATEVIGHLQAAIVRITKENNQ